MKSSAAHTSIPFRSRPWQDPATGTPGALRLQEDLEVTDLVRRHLGGDPVAFRELVQRYRTRLLRFVNGKIRDEERAEDLVQETFIRVSRHLHNFDTSRKFSTWVFTIALNLTKNELRARRRSLVVYNEYSAANREEECPSLQFEDVSTRPDKVLADQTLSELVDSIIARLAPLYREVIVLREIEGRSYEEISGIAGCGLGAVKSRLHRARMSFVAMISPHLD